MNYATLMIYTKIPERIFYGLLRSFGKDVFIQTSIYIEKEGKYEKYDLPLRLRENLNTQSLYRSEQYWINKCEMIEKGNMIGIEVVDLLLGIIRLIIKNKEIPSAVTIENDPALKGSKGLYFKTLLVIELLNIPLFKSFIENIRFYEWNNSKVLSEVSFKDYLDLLMAKQYKYFHEK